ncbi:MAG: IS630 family transposase [Myxococcota bacterium]
MVWIDETGFRTHMTRTRGWGKRGKRVRFTLRRRNSPYTLVCAMGWDGVLAESVFPGGLDHKRWLTFIKTRLIDALEPGRIILWDNLNIHQNQEVLEMLRNAGHFVWFTPPYSPEGNPIEYMFSKLKTFVRKQCPRSAATLRQAIADGLETITQQDVAAYFFVAWGHVVGWR